MYILSTDCKLVQLYVNKKVLKIYTDDIEII